MEKIEQNLKSLGLTEYEVKAYLTLLKLKIATAENISEMGSIPLPRVYDTIAELQKKGFVLVNKSRPKKFKVVPADKSLYRFIELQKKSHEEKINKLRSNIKDLLVDLKNIQNTGENLVVKEEEESGIWSVEKRKNIVNFLDDQKTKAKKEVLIFAGDMSWLSESANVIRELKKRGITIKALVRHPETIAIKENITKAKKLGIEIKSGYEGYLRGHIIDGEKGAVVVKTSKGLSKDFTGSPDSDETFKYELMLLNNPVLIKTFMEYFNFWWKSLK